jgi:hypothetical protein
LLRRVSTFDDLEQSGEDAFCVVPDVGLTETRIKAKRLSLADLKRVRRIDSQESTLLFDEENTLDSESSVGVNNEGGILEVRNEERKNRKKLIFRELLSRKRA